MKKLIKLILAMGITCFLIILTLNIYMKLSMSKYIVEAKKAPKADAILVLGSYVFPDGRVSDILGDRLNTALEVQKLSKTEKFLVTGDHGRVEYDEVNTMKKYLRNKGVKGDRIFMDHAGFNTYQSMYRAKDIFKVKKVIIITQKYHLTRALYIARKLGLEAYGVSADKHFYASIVKFSIREYIARCKDFFNVNIFKPSPKFLGEAIPIWNSGALTDDKKE